MLECREINNIVAQDRNPVREKLNCNSHLFHNLLEIFSNNITVHFFLSQKLDFC